MNQEVDIHIFFIMKFWLDPRVHCKYILTPTNPNSRKKAVVSVIALQSGSFLPQCTLGKSLNRNSREQSYIKW